MKKKFRIIKEKEIEVLIQNIIIYCSIFSVFLFNNHFSNDTLDVLYHGTSEIHLMHFRYLTYFIYKCFDLLNIKPYDYLQFGQFFLIVCISFLSWRIYLLFSNIYHFSTIALYIIRVFSILLFANISYYEGWFYFPESYASAGIGSVILYFSFSAYTKSYDNRKHLFISFILISCAINMYQIYIEPYVILCTLYLIFISKNFTSYKILMHEVRMLVIAGSASLLNIISIHLLNFLGTENYAAENYVSFTLDTLINNVDSVIRIQKNIWMNFYGLMPKFILPLTGIILLIIFVFFVHEYKKIECLILILFIIGMYFVIFFPVLFSTNLWAPPRTIYGFFVFIASIFMLSVLVNNKYIKKTALFFSVVLCISMAMQINKISVNNIISNRLDEETALLVQDRIDQYEAESNNVISTIVIGRDEIVKYAYSSVEYVVYDTNSRGYAVGWNDINIINYYAGKNYNKREMTEEEYHYYFNTVNYDSLNLEKQLKFDGECAYFLIY